jgi:hypothetical protein
MNHCIQIKLPEIKTHLPPQKKQKRKDQTHKHTVPQIPPRITAQKRNAPLKIHNHILTIPDLITKEDLVTCEMVESLERRWAVGEEAAEGLVAVVEVGCCGCEG